MQVLCWGVTPPQQSSHMWAARNKLISIWGCPSQLTKHSAQGTASLVLNSRLYAASMQVLCRGVRLHSRTATCRQPASS